MNITIKPLVPELLDVSVFVNGVISLSAFFKVSNVNV